MESSSALPPPPPYHVFFIIQIGPPGGLIYFVWMYLWVWFLVGRHLGQHPSGHLRDSAPSGSFTCFGFIKWIHQVGQEMVRRCICAVRYRIPLDIGVQSA
jgi:hypothetical protein